MTNTEYGKRGAHVHTQVNVPVYQGHRDQKLGHQFYSQRGEDIFLLNLCEYFGLEIPKLKYLDLGAHHPETISNTKLLYDRGASGVAVDANVVFKDEWARLRPKDLFVPYGVMPKAGRYMFHMIGRDSGRNTFSDAEVERADLQEGLKVYRTEVIECVTADYLVEMFFGGMLWPDILLIDIEGVDSEVLESCTFEPDNRPKIIVIEARDKEQTHQALHSKGYRTVCPYFGDNLIAVDGRL